MSGKKQKAIRRAIRKEIRKADLKAKKPRYIPKMLWNVFMKRASLVFGKVGATRDHRISDPGFSNVSGTEELKKYQIAPIKAFIFTHKHWWQFWRPKKVYGDVGQYTKMGRQVNVMINGGFYLTGKDVTIRGIVKAEKPKED